MFFDPDLWLPLWLSHLLTAKAVIVFMSLVVALTLIGMAWSIWGPGQRPK
jgi:hypothetical protein